MVSSSGYFQAYDNCTSRWLELPKLEGYCCYSGCIHQGKVYILCSKSPCAIGGLCIFDPTKNKWQIIESKNKSLKEDKLVSYQNKLWAVGNLQLNDGYPVGLGIGIFDTYIQEWNYCRVRNFSNLYEGQSRAPYQASVKVKQAIVF